MPPGLTLHTSNRLEILADQLGEILANPLASPLTPEIIVVQSNGMRRWLTQKIAQSQGICANVRFPFPQNFFHDLFVNAFPKSERTEVFARDPMTWRIMKLLPQFSAQPSFAPVTNYLAGERAESRAFELSQKIARVFDQYLVFRPQMIRDWDAGAGDDWQPILWRELQGIAPGQHQAALGTKLADALADGAPVPARVLIFGISALPPFYLSLVEQVSARCPVHLFVMEPTPYWWGEIRSRRERSRAKQPELFDFGGEPEPQNPLLAENGKLGREFLHLITDLNPSAQREQFVPATADSILHKIQRDIFELRDSTPEKKKMALADARSLQIHSCHSVVRELEVLHDQLLALFENNRALQPHEIVVMAPSVSTYAPFIDAVFGVPENPAHAIPYTIADRAPRARSGVIDTFLRVLEILPGRFAASEVLELLESPALQNRFQIAPAEVETIRQWIEQCAIRWGIDAAHRVRLGLPAFAENSWRHGLDRMLLGYALRADELFGGILPYDEIEGGNAFLLGNFVELMERLFARAQDFARPRSLVDWQRALRSVADDFLDPDELGQLELNQLRNAIEELGKIMKASENDEPVSLEIIALQLKRSLEESNGGAGFLSGAVTFCALKPMRSIPFKVVCLLGMNGTAYPRRERAPEFDLITQKRQPGDRHTRDDDRALFLEAILSAREVFYLSYLGQSFRDNSALPPSVLVSELIDYVARRFGIAADEIAVKHSLQAFSARNFGAEDKRAFSYSLDNSAAGKVAGQGRRDPLKFFDQPLGEPEEEWREIELGRLVDFFAHPSEFFLKQRLGLSLPREEEELEDREPFALHNLRKYDTEQRLLDDALAGRDLAAATEIVRAQGILPAGGAGSLAFDELCQNDSRARRNRSCATGNNSRRARRICFAGNA